MKTLRHTVGLLTFGIIIYLVIIFFPYILMSVIGLIFIGLVAATALYLYIRHLLNKAQKDFTQAMEDTVKNEFKQRTDAFFEEAGIHVKNAKGTQEQPMVIHVEAETVQND